MTEDGLISRTFQKTFPAPALARLQTTLIMAEHDNSRLSRVTLHAVTAAGPLSGELHCLVAGTDCGEVVRRRQSAAGRQRCLQGLPAGAACPRDGLRPAPVQVQPHPRRGLHLLPLRHVPSGLPAGCARHPQHHRGQGRQHLCQNGVRQQRRPDPEVRGSGQDDDGPVA